MSAPEPVLSPDDVAIWDAWWRAAEVHARTRAHLRRLDSARRCIAEALATAADWCAMWSGGKDSTAMTHLLRQEAGRLPVYSEKDDLDYPGEREYVERLGAAWDLDLRVLVPPVSPRRWIAEHAAELSAEADMHSRAAGLSKACFYEVAEAAGAAHAGAFLGLRAEESRGRAASRATHGRLYRKRPNRWHPAGQRICTPLGDWRGLDVMAYLAAHGIEPLPVYRCVALLAADEPWRVRKSWWIPGADARWGGLTWLRRYWPSLHAQLCEWLPDTRRLT